MGRNDRRRRARGHTANGDLLGTLGKTRAETAALVRGLEAHRQQTELLLKEIHRQEMDTGRLLRGIAEILDTFDRLVAYDGTDIDTYRGSVRKTADLLMDVLCDNSGIELIGRPGETAQPATHHVIHTNDEHDLPQDAVIKVIQRGIRYRGELVRPASVIVSSGRKQHA